MIKEYGIVLAGGGAKGAYEAGALKALKELGLTDNILAASGTSIGGVNLSFLATAKIDNLYEAWQHFRKEDFLETDRNGFDISKYGDGIFSRDALVKLIKENVDYISVSKATFPLFLTLCYKDEKMQNRLKYIKINDQNADYIEKYILATSAFPFVYDAVDIDGTLYFDGGLLDNTPIFPIYNLGVKDIIVISNDSNYKTNKSIYPDANIIDIVPSASLDMDSLYGTFDLDEYHAYYRLRLGYYDAKMIVEAELKEKFKPDLTMNDKLASQEMNIKKNQFNPNISKLENMLSKYGIDL